MLIDLDPQTHLTYSLGILTHELSATVNLEIFENQGILDKLIAHYKKIMEA
jgi:cellulose biosynthesis protein BcsQ